MVASLNFDASENTSALKFIKWLYDQGVPFDAKDKVSCSDSMASYMDWVYYCILYPYLSIYVNRKVSLRMN
jgi:hypothetical protein